MSHRSIAEIRGISLNPKTALMPGTLPFVSSLIEVAYPITYRLKAGGSLSSPFVHPCNKKSCAMCSKSSSSQIVDPFPRNTIVDYSCTRATHIL